MIIPSQGNMLEVGQCKNPKSVDLIFFSFLSKFDLHFRDPSDRSRSVKILVRIHAIVIAKNPEGQVAGSSRLTRRSLGVRGV